MIKQVQSEQNDVETETERSIRGKLAPKMFKEDENREPRIQNVIANRRNTLTANFLLTIAHNFSL